jgi:hypothetical protein
VRRNGDDLASLLRVLKRHGLRLPRAAAAKREIDRLSSGRRPTPKRRDPLALMRAAEKRLSHVARVNPLLR